MSVRKVYFIAARVLRQLAHDPRTLGLIFAVPSALLVLVKYVFYNNTAVVNSIEPMMLGIFPLTIMFLVSSITTLRERTIGTLDRLMSMPIAKMDFVAGYAAAFSLVAIIQACLACVVIVDVLRIPVAGGTLLLLVGGVLGAFLGASLGLLVSAFAQTEFQAVQFLPAVIFPQLLTCGLFVPRDQMASFLQKFANVLPMTYSVDAMKRITAAGGWSGNLTKDYVIVISYALVVLVLGAITIRRRD